MVWCLLGYQRASRRGLLATVAAAIVLASLVVWTAPAQPILARVRETLSLGAAGRTAIWADAQTVSRAFLLTGTGLGTFERSMLDLPDHRPPDAHQPGAQPVPAADG